VLFQNESSRSRLGSLSHLKGLTKIIDKNLIHRGLKLDGAIGQGEIFNSLKSEKFSKSFLSHIGKNKIK